ncbi:MAG: FHA domain-containing protein [Bdellovibrionales bacterium]|nr:FHA domain-containing protein [Ramlibacter sp.]
MAEGQSVLVGRDTDCDLCLPDPERTVSRQHVVMWVQGGQMNLRVLSVVNGVDLSTGELLPGGVAVLGMGEVVVVGDYNITLAAALDDVAADASASGIATGAMVAHGDQDPFGEWGFDASESLTHMPHTLHMAADLAASAISRLPGGSSVMSADAAALFAGLGIAPDRLGAMGTAELEAAGRRIRIAMQGLFELYEAKVELTREMGADERTMVAARETNPLKTDWALNTKLEYLLGAQPLAPAFAAPETALASLVDELRIHDMAVTAASRAVLEGALREFEPERLQASIAQDKSQGSLLARLRPWEAFARFHAQESSRMPQWLDRLFNRFFLPAYTRETTRMKRESTRLE